MIVARPALMPTVMYVHDKYAFTPPYVYYIGDGMDMFNDKSKSNAMFHLLWKLGIRWKK